MPYENEHACRISDPAQYDSFARKNCEEKSNGKCIDVIYGIKDNKSEIQALRYPKDIWTESSARSHCKSRDGSFEPAKKAEGRTMKLSYRNQHNAEATARFWGKTLDKPDWYKIESLSDDEAEILIYDIIGWPFNDAAEFVRTLAEMKQKTITVRINSPGGDVFDAMAIFNALQSHNSKIITRIESLAASSASFIALAGKEVQAYKNAMLMIHNPWVLAVGNQYDLREIADILDKISGNMVDIYAENSNVGKREVAQMMRDETWMTAKEAKDKGFIDTILESGNGAKAQFDLSIFVHAPDDLLPKNQDTEPTLRELEKMLTGCGISQHRAKAILAGCKRTNDEIEAIAAFQKTLTIIGGK